MQNIPKRLIDYCPDVEKALSERGDAPELPLITMSSLNFLIWGVHRRKLMVIGARTSNGKSDLAINIAYDLATQKKKVLFLSLEMTGDSITERIFCYENKISNRYLLTGKFKEYSQQWILFKKKINDMDLVISDFLGKGIGEADNYITNLTIKPDIVIIDHLQEIHKSDKDKRDSIDRYVDNMRVSSIRHNFALVICSQVNRISQEDKNKKPQLHHLKGSGAIEEMADIVLLLHYPYHYGQNENINYFELNVAKNRGGMTGNIKLKYFPQFSRFEDWDEIEEKIQKQKKENWEE